MKQQANIVNCQVVFNVIFGYFDSVDIIRVKGYVDVMYN